MTRRYNFSLAQRARIEARQKLRKKEKQVQQAIKKADNRKQQAKRLKESLKTVDAINKKGGAVTGELLDSVPK